MKDKNEYIETPRDRDFANEEIYKHEFGDEEDEENYGTVQEEMEEEE